MSFRINSQDRIYQQKIILATKNVPNQVSREKTLQVCKILLTKYKPVFDALKNK